MIKIIITLILIFLFLISGKIIQGLKKLVSLVVSNFLKILNFFGIKILYKEKQVKISEEFKQSYKDIKMIKLSKKNIKQRYSIDWIYLGIFISASLLVILNLNSISGNAISNWLFNLIKNLKFVKSSIDMNTLYTATIFSILSFSASKLLQRWKETKEQRLENKRRRLKEEAIKIMNSKELLDNARKKDEDKLKELK